MEKSVRVATYSRVSTLDQTTENQSLEMARYARARGWQIVSEYTDHGVSGAKDSRPGLNKMLRDAKARRFDVLLVYRLDRLGRSVRHLVMLLDDLQSVGVSFVSISEAIDLGSIGGRFMCQILAAVAELERGLISERVKVGLSRARAHGKTLGRPRLSVTDDQLRSVDNLSLRLAAEKLRVSKSHVARWRRQRKAA